MKLVIEEMFAFVAENEEGEGIVGINGPGGWTPLVDMERINNLMPMAMEIGKDFDKKIVLKKFKLVSAEAIGEVN